MSRWQWARAQGSSWLHWGAILLEGVGMGYVQGGQLGLPRSGVLVRSRELMNERGLVQHKVQSAHKAEC